MKLSFLRNATLVINSGDHHILVDPMLSPPGSLMSMARFRHKSKRNPLVHLPSNSEDVLASVTSCIITHCQLGHVDHLDRDGIRMLHDRGIPTFCREGDVTYLAKKGIGATPLTMNKRQPYLGGTITPIPTKHGYGWISRLMGPGVGYVIELPGEPSLYLSGDTVLTGCVRDTLREMKPDISVVAAGGASLDIGQPILMRLDDVLEFIELAPGHVIANHLEAVNHCPVTRRQLLDAARKKGLAEKLSIPADGEVLVFDEADFR